MLWRTLLNLYARYKSQRKLSKFVREFRAANKNNKVFPVGIFPIDIVKIGDYSYGELDLLAYDEANKVDTLNIGSFVSISSDVRFLLHENHQTATFTTFPLKTVFIGRPDPSDALAKGSITIDDEVWIGNRAMILSGVTVGKGAIIAAGAVVTKNVPPYSVIGGIPARVIKYRFDRETRERLLRLRLCKLTREQIIYNIDLFYQPIDNDHLSRIEGLFDRVGCGE